MTLADLALPALGLTEADCKLGFKVVPVELRSGGERTVKLTALSESRRKKLFLKYASSEDPAVLLIPMLERGCDSEKFLSSLTPSSVAKLCNVAIGLYFGPKGLRQFVEFGAQQMFGQRGRSMN